LGVRQRAAASSSISACAYNEIPAIDEIALAHTSNTFLRRRPAKNGSDRRGARQNLEILGARGMRKIRAACAQECAAFIFQQAPVKKKRERKQCNRRAVERDIALPHYFSDVTLQPKREKVCDFICVLWAKIPKQPRALFLSVCIDLG
jgi:hypothetical protein